MSTIREVAARAGVSVTTVSRTLNNRGYISQKMRERISKAMAELNYQPNEVARSLSFQHTKMIGVLVPEIDNPFFSRIVSLLSKLLTDRGYKMLLYVASGTDDDAPDYINMLKSNQVDGIIIALRSKNIDHELLGGMPAVSFERLPSGKFDTNELVLELAILAYNILRMIGQESLGKKDSPMKHNVRRRRLRTVISNLVMMANHVTEHARRIMIGLGQSNVWRFAFSRIYTAFVDFSF